ncbi:MAG: hypothetical protein K6F64_01565 [Clostridia bacterium]|nr:hypothetical protein [Clostridia bacterium]
MSGFIKRIICLSLCAVLLSALCSCNKAGNTESVALKVGVSGMTGNFNPFYATESGDVTVNSLLFDSLQSVRGETHKNNAGSITYKVMADGTVSYTVTVEPGLVFSDGTPVTIDDVIFFYYFISDATYKGVYSDFYLNDIAGLKEYYYDDPDYSSSGITPGSEGEKAYINANYSDEIKVKEISGIKRVDDYTCTVLYNTPSLSALSELNAVIVSSARYGANYIKGGAQAVESIRTPVGSGAYFIDDYKSGKANLRVNNYIEPRPYFKELDMIETPDEDQPSALANGKLDVISVRATAAAMSVLKNDNIFVSLSDETRYYTVFFNTATLPDEEIRRSLMADFSDYSALDEYAGEYYTKLYLPLSLNYTLADRRSAPYYLSEVFSVDMTALGLTLNAVYPQEDYAGELILKSYSAQLSSYGVNLQIIPAALSDIYSGSASAGADLILVPTEDGGSISKYDYYNSAGNKNYFHFSSPLADALTLSISSAIGYGDYRTPSAELLDHIMKSCVELPICQFQTVIAVNLSAVSENAVDSLPSAYSLSEIITALY